MERLRGDLKNASALERQQFAYLDAYRIGVYEDRLNDGAAAARKLFLSAKDPNVKYRAGGLVASFSAVNRDLSTGVRFLNRAMQLRDKVTDSAIRHEGIANAALLYTEMGQFRLAEQYAKEVLDDSPNPRMRCIAGHHLATAQVEIGNDDINPESIQSVIDQCLSEKEYIAANLARASLARLLVRRNMLNEASSLLEEALPQVRETRYPRLIAEINSILSEIKLKLGDDSAAKSHADETIALGEQIKSSLALVRAYETLYLLAEKKEPASEALKLHIRFADAKLDHSNDVRAKELAFEVVRHETMRQSQQIELLERQNEVLQLEQELDKQSALKARLAMVFLMLVLAAVIYWMLQIKRHQRQLQRLAQTDMLTGVGNRHYFTLKSEKALVEAAREGEQAALVMFDLDHFKAINDTYGHAAGDWVLKQVGKICRTHCRKTDFLGRIGGEEFAVMLRGVDLAEAARIAEDCRSTLAQIDTRESGYSFVVTGSFGVTSTGQSGYDLSRLMSHADQMLYRAKHEGRNRVCVYAPDSPESKPGRRSAPALTVVGR